MKIDDLVPPPPPSPPSGPALPHIEGDAPLPSVSPAPSVARDVIATDEPMLRLFDALGPPSLPEEDAVLPKGISPETAKSHVATLETLKDDVLSAETLFEVIGKARELQAHPENSVVLGIFNEPSVKESLAKLVSDGRLAGELRWTQVQQKMLEVLPAETVLALSQQREHAEGLLGKLFDGGDVIGALSKLAQQPLNDAVANIANAFMRFNKDEPPPPAAPEDHAQVAAYQASPPAQLDGVSTLLGLAVLGEASIEFLIGHGAKLMNDDINEHLSMIADSLRTLKKERQAIGARINAMGTAIHAQQMQVTAAAQKASRLNDGMIALAATAALFTVIFAVVAVVIAVVVLIAVVIAICSAGTCSWVSVLIICCLVAVVIGAVGTLVVTVLINLQPLLKGLALLLKYLGLTEQSQKVTEVEEWWYDNVASKDWFIYGCIAAMLIFGIIGAIGALANPSYWWLVVIQMCVGLSSAAVKLGLVIGNYIVATEMAKVQRQLSMLAAQSQELAMKLGALHLEVQKLRALEEEETQRIETLESARERVMTSFQKAASALADMKASLQ